MIYSSIYAGGAGQYPAAIQRALDYLKTTDITALEPANYPIEGALMFAKVFDNTSKPVTENHPEYHIDYIDVQFFPDGGELMGICPKKEQDYEIVGQIEAEDVWFVGDVEGEQFLRMDPGDFCVLFPGDIHRPGTCDGQPRTYRKCVVKVAVSLLEQEGV